MITSRSASNRPAGRAVAVSSAFDENAIRAIAAGAERHGLLTRRAIRNQAPLLSIARASSRVLPQFALLQQFVRKQSARVESGRLRQDVQLAPMAEFTRVLGGRMRSPLTHTLGNAAWKVAYDKSAQNVDFGDAEILFSMPGSSLETFKRNSDRELVLHEIDAHPRVRNTMLESFFGARRAHAEMYPEWFVERIEAELDLADKVLVPGRVVAEQMLSHGISAEKIIQIPYGVDPAIFQPREHSGDADTSIGRRVQIVCTAQICLRKGIPFLLDAVRGLPVDLTLVGQVFDRRILRNAPDNVRLAGVLTATELADLYARSDLFVLPSIEDNFGLVVSEAAASGLPVVTTREVGAHVYLSGHHTVLDAGDAHRLRTVLSEAPRLSWERRQTISQEAIQSGWTSWSHYADNVLKATGAVS
ncbi:glycosyltransferase involved in cell wall biosynthesis [Arthrobacter woluwensis]|uniref:glycosyltransferase family 4 protein n=1 Tax=Arthrobacter woluwensis TaxID=156980 RepID=UPI00277D2F16|nr:glycosyltransferase family 4 protein [Arthrobacter woluwensis]MDQ0707838.1 glycosyltransferase involved in cell wall biosynthesis [Arthrobacter woluwensis]